jgi:phage tail sheath protein FI
VANSLSSKDVSSTAAYVAYLRRSITARTQSTPYEPNGERLWANVQRTIEDFLLAEWQKGALLGDTPENAFFVTCDRETMSQRDLDLDKLQVVIGVALLRPDEFVIQRFELGHSED